MVWATSLPYAPTFWIGVPPTRPGMPDRASMPLHSCATAVATRASQSSPAATVTVAPLQSETSAAMPRVATRTTVPGNPWSAISRFEPPPEHEHRLAGGVGRADRVDQLGLGGRP